MRSPNYEQGVGTMDYSTAYIRFSRIYITFTTFKSRRDFLSPPPLLTLAFCVVIDIQMIEISHAFPMIGNQARGFPSNNIAMPQDLQRLNVLALSRREEEEILSTSNDKEKYLATSFCSA